MLIKYCRRFSLFLGMLCLIAQTTMAQEQTGLRLGNYAGANGLLLNPASGLSGNLQWDVNLISAGFFFENNYGYVGKAALLPLIKSDFDVGTAEQVDPENYQEGARFYADFFNNNQQKSIHLNTFVTGPSVMLRTGNHSFGLFTNARAVVSSNRIPNILGYYEFYDTEYGEEVEIGPVEAGGLAWGEVGLHYGHQLELGSGNLSLAGNLKFIKPLEGFYFKSKSPIFVTTINSDTIRSGGVDMEYSFSNGFSYEDEELAYNGSKGGFGMSVDLGAVYEIEQSNGLPLKLGASLIDFGKVGMPGQRHTLTTPSTIEISLTDYENVTSEEELTQLISDDILNNITASRTGDRTSMWLPGGISLSADMGFTENFYVNATMVRRLRYFKPGVERSNILAVTPRLEMRWVEAGLPIVLYNDKDLRVGASLRLGPLTLGTDDFGSIFVPGKLSGTDFYVALRVYPFWNKKEGQDGKFGKSGKVKCYKW